MTKLVSKILLAIFMFPLAGVLYIAVFASLEGLLKNDKFALLWADIAVGFFVVVYWLALWRGSVRWTRARVTGTFLAGVGCLAAGAVVGVVVAAQMQFGNDAFAIFLGGITAITLWPAVTVLLWRETAAERAERIRQSAGDVLFCPKCGYNMTGLYEGRCPECGTRYTLDQLYSAQSRDVIDDAIEPGEKAVGK